MGQEGTYLHPNNKNLMNKIKRLLSWQYSGVYVAYYPS